MPQSAMKDRNAYLKEYSAEEVIDKYVTETAGKGIQYVLSRIYGPLYSEIIDTLCTETVGSKRFRVLEYGCGAGMNLLHIVRLLCSKGVPVGAAIGTDFSNVLIKAAENERDELMAFDDQKTITFVEASNESLLEDLAKGTSQSMSSLCNSFHLVVGVNTFRYAIRLHKQQECANDISSLLTPGGYSVMIDMNNKFPFFMSKVRNYVGKATSEDWLPSLEEYATPFTAANLEIVQARHFCWIPHSGGSVTVNVTKMVAPFLNVLAPSFAMRSLVVAKKTGNKG